MDTPPSSQTPETSSTLERWIRRFPKGSIWQTRFICLPAMIVVATWAFSSHRFDDRTSLAKTLFFAAGILSWTLLEYILHRWVLHYRPQGAIGQAILDRLHIFHHADPKDQTQVCIPPSLVLPTGLVLFGILKGGLGFESTPTVFFLSGLMLMLVIYDITHFSTHYMPASNRLLQHLKKNHMLHHFAHDDRRFGVTSPLWDYVFRTHR